MSLLKIIRQQLGLSVTPANNFTLDASADNGTMKLARGNAGATTQDILTIDASGNTVFPQTISSVGGYPSFVCRAWVNFNGTGTVAIRESGNVSSITDNGTGDYTVNFTTAMPDANYSCSFMGQGIGPSNWWRTGQPGAPSVNGFSTTSLRFQTPNTSGTAVDTDIATVAIFR
jgi:hypothetical protein